MAMPISSHIHPGTIITCYKTILLPCLFARRPAAAKLYLWWCSYHFLQFVVLGASPTLLLGRWRAMYSFIIAITSKYLNPVATIDVCDDVVRLYASKPAILKLYAQ